MHPPENHLPFSQVGAQEGRLLVYFHGAPGSPEEIRIFDQTARQHGSTIICFDRFAVDASIKGEAYYQHLAMSIESVVGGRSVAFIGFSIGAFVAIQTSRYMVKGIRHLHLVSAAAPLDAGDYLDAMAGKHVFKLAFHSPWTFRLLSRWQGLLALLFPMALYRLLFSTAAGDDVALREDLGFQTSMIKELRVCFTRRLHGYVRDVDAYVRPWKATLSETTVSTSIWHGDADNWSPPHMADDLQSAIPGCISKKVFGGLSHYSCLERAVREICAAPSSE